MHHQLGAILFLVAVAMMSVTAVTHSDVSPLSCPSVVLPHAPTSQPPVTMPFIGLGTGGYLAQQRNRSMVVQQVLNWVGVAGGRRIDTSYTYGDQVYIGEALQILQDAPYHISRSDVFVTSKVGPGMPLGYNETIQQTAQVLSTLNVSYVDLLLVHWPDNGNGANGDPTSSDPACQPSLGGSAQACRRSTWAAMEVAFQEGYARRIGVSNYMPGHLADIFEAPGLKVKPCLNQVELHPYWFSGSQDIIAATLKYGMVINSYSPFGAPDYVLADHLWGGNNTLFNDPYLRDIAAKYPGRTLGEVLTKWHLQQGIVLNPRSMNITHMKENLRGACDNSWSVSEDDITAISRLSNPSYGKICPDPRTWP